ncbi:unnamed protein product [Sphagnum jensenii]|uniref:Glycerol-3-phosphate dehydrogenase n=1 Tax=Sphagnum jensenii TaxID=128206 RepID=A0ABP1BCA2_9BRYO
MASGTRLRRFAYYGAVVVGTAAALGFTSAHNSSSANPFSRDRRSSGEISAITERMSSTGWRVPNRNTQEAALRGSSEVSPFDVLVIGGGATGCGVALDAATRGLRVGLVERDDYSAGTSSRSTKLVHGGVRYLEKAFWQFDYGQLKLVFHALEERARILHNAPHLCNALPTMTPCYEWWEIPYYWAGLKLYDLVAGSRMLHMSRYFSRKESMEAFPTLAQQNALHKTLKGTVVYYDGQMNDSRLNVAIACTAALAGAVVLNHAEAVSLKKDEVTGNVTGARICNKLTGKEFDVHAKVVINAAGPFCDEVRKMADKNAPQIISPSSGVHVVLPDYYSPDHMGLIVPKTKDGRVIFMLPWLGRTVAGTTDSATNLTMLPEAHEEEIEFILDAISDYLVVKVRRSDVMSAWSGIRPLATDPNVKGTDTASISRDHVVCLDSDGLVTVTGGKWTTYRSMAEDAVDVAIKSGSLQPMNGCITQALPLVGANGWDPSSFTVLAQNYVRMKRSYGGKIVPGAMDTAAAKHLVQTYGGLAPQVALIAQLEGLGKRLAHGYPYLEAEVAYCARNEYCESAVDFIARRARLAFLDTDAANRALPRVIEILAAEHRWDRARRKAEMADAITFLETFKFSRNAQFDDGKHRAR